MAWQLWMKGEGPLSAKETAGFFKGMAGGSHLGQIKRQRQTERREVKGARA